MSRNYQPAKYVQVSRDPLSRQTLVRRLVPAHPLGCDWCGQVRAGDKLYEYGLDADRVHDSMSWFKGQFCCIGCFRSYHQA